MFQRDTTARYLLCVAMSAVIATCDSMHQASNINTRQAAKSSTPITPRHSKFDKDWQQKNSLSARLTQTFEQELPDIGQDDAEVPIVKTYQFRSEVNNPAVLDDSFLTYNASRPLATAPTIHFQHTVISETKQRIVAQCDEQFGCPEQLLRGQVLAIPLKGEEAYSALEFLSSPIEQDSSRDYWHQYAQEVLQRHNDKIVQYYVPNDENTVGIPETTGMGRRNVLIDAILPETNLSSASENKSTLAQGGMGVDINAAPHEVYFVAFRYTTDESSPNHWIQDASHVDTVYTFIDHSEAFHCAADGCFGPSGQPWSLSTSMEEDGPSEGASILSAESLGLTEGGFGFNLMGGTESDSGPFDAAKEEENLGCRLPRSVINMIDNWTNDIFFSSWTNRLFNFRNATFSTEEWQTQFNAFLDRIADRRVPVRPETFEGYKPLIKKWYNNSLKAQLRRNNKSFEEAWPGDLENLAKAKWEKACAVVDVNGEHVSRPRVSVYTAAYSKLMKRAEDWLWGVVFRYVEKYPGFFANLHTTSSRMAALSHIPPMDLDSYGNGARSLRDVFALVFQIQEEFQSSQLDGMNTAEKSYSAIKDFCKKHPSRLDAQECFIYHIAAEYGHPYLVLTGKYVEPLYLRAENPTTIPTMMTYDFEKMQWNVGEAKFPYPDSEIAGDYYNVAVKKLLEKVFKPQVMNLYHTPAGDDGGADLRTVNIELGDYFALPKIASHAKTDILKYLEKFKGRTDYYGHLMAYERIKQRFENSGNFHVILHKNDYQVLLTAMGEEFAEHIKSVYAVVEDKISIWSAVGTFLTAGQVKALNGQGFLDIKQDAINGAHAVKTSLTYIGVPKQAKVIRDMDFSMEVAEHAFTSSDQAFLWNISMVFVFLAAVAATRVALALMWRPAVAMIGEAALINGVRFVVALGLSLSTAVTLVHTLLYEVPEDQISFLGFFALLGRNFVEHGAKYLFIIPIGCLLVVGLPFSWAAAQTFANAASFTLGFSVALAEIGTSVWIGTSLLAAIGAGLYFTYEDIKLCGHSIRSYQSSQSGDPDGNLRLRQMIEYCLVAEVDVLGFTTAFSPHAPYSGVTKKGPHADFHSTPGLMYQLADDLHLRSLKQVMDVNDSPFNILGLAPEQLDGMDAGSRSVEIFKAYAAKSADNNPDHVTATLFAATQKELNTAKRLLADPTSYRMVSEAHKKYQTSIDSGDIPAPFWEKSLETGEMAENLLTWAYYSRRGGIANAPDNVVAAGNCCKSTKPIPERLQQRANQLEIEGMARGETLKHHMKAIHTKLRSMIEEQKIGKDFPAGTKDALSRFKAPGSLTIVEHVPTGKKYYGTSGFQRRLDPATGEMIIQTEFPDNLVVLDANGKPAVNNSAFSDNFRAQSWDEYIADMPESLRKILDEIDKANIEKLKTAFDKVVAGEDPNIFAALDIIIGGKEEQPGQFLTRLEEWHLANCSERDAMTAALKDLGDEAIHHEWLMVSVDISGKLKKPVGPKAMCANCQDVTLRIPKAYVITEPHATSNCGLHCQLPVAN